MKSIKPFLTGASIVNLIGLLTKNTIEKKYWIRLFETLLSSISLAPFYFIESLLARIVPRPLMHPAPVFVIGHWRSGTTYLHYLLSKDKQFAYCTNVDAFAPGALFAGRWLLSKIIAMRLPKKRPMDDVNLEPTSPQEDEFPMMLLTPYSFYHAFVFPRKLSEFFTKYVVFDPQKNVELIRRWRKSYYEYLLRLSRRHDNKRLLLKNPVNTARVKYLVDLFPDAKFIYIHRSPSEVKLSTLRMFKALIAANSLQTPDEKELEAQVELGHQCMIREYEDHRHNVAENNLVEVGYDELLRQPFDTLKKIYATLQLKEFDKAKEAFKQFIAEQKGYKPFEYSNQPRIKMH